MTVTGKPITALPAAESVTNEDLLVVYKDGQAKRAAASMFRGDPAKINGVNALTLEAGENVTMSQDGDTLRVSATDTTYDAATTSAAGLMSAADKSKLDGIPADATNNAGTVTGITMNGVSKGTSGVIDLGTVITEHQDISGKVDASRIGAANGVAELDANGKVPSAQLPAYVDDVLEYTNRAAFPVTGENGKIYVAIDTNLTYRWSGSTYVEISPSLALGETSSTAYRGDRGKIAYDHSQTVTGNPHNVTKSDVRLGNVDNTSDADKPVSTATQAALNAKQNKLSATGAANRGVYVSASGVVSAMTHTLDKDVPADAKFTDTVTPVDATLSNAGQAADAKAAGDAIARLDSLADGAPRDIIVTLTPAQSGNGDPYPPGGGPNPLDLRNGVSGTGGGVTYTRLDDGSYRREGTATDGVGNVWFRGGYPDTQVLFTLLAGRSYLVRDCALFYNRTAVMTTNGIINPTSDLSVGGIRNPLQVVGNAYNDIIRPMVLDLTAFPDADASGNTWYPYENIRPITGAASVTVTKNGVPVTVSLSPAGTVYGGTLNVTTGELSVTWGNIDQYNGETLPGRWISDRDVYAAGTSPTTGAQVVYELATPAAYQLTPAQISALPTDTVTADAGSVSLSVRAVPVPATAAPLADGTAAVGTSMAYARSDHRHPLVDFTALAAQSSVPEQHRMVFGGRNLGSSVTAAQIAAVRNGSFSGLLVGDYWVINSVTWRIVDMDYWYGCGDTAFNRHHLVIMPDSTLTVATMNDTNTTTGGYTGSKMYTDTLPTVKTTCQAAFPSMVLSHREYLVNAVTDGKPSAGAWTDSDVELPSEIMMYGSHIISPGNDGATVAILYTISKSQLALFSLAPRFIKALATFWLRDPVSATTFAGVGYASSADNYGASRDYGVRPVFPVG